MKESEHYCSVCDDEEVFIEAGLIPTEVMFSSAGSSEDTPYWIKAFVCSGCGSVDGEIPTEEEISRGEERLVRIMVNENIVPEERARKVLGL